MGIEQRPSTVSSASTQLADIEREYHRDTTKTESGRESISIAWLVLELTYGVFLVTTYLVKGQVWSVPGGKWD